MESRLTNSDRLKVLIVDLNNFSLYPTISIGYLTAALRRQQMQVTVLSPLAHGIRGVVREPPENWYQNLGRRVNMALAQSPGSLSQTCHEFVKNIRSRISMRHFPRIGEIFSNLNPAEFDIVLISAYLMYYPVCIEIGRVCHRAGVPLLIGGPYFAQPGVAKDWLGISGVTALVGGEVELELPELVRAAVRGGDLASFGGVWLPDGTGGPRKPLLDLDSVPFPDYSDFPWERYPHRIIPLITGRGCAWGVCTFCSDVTSSSGRTFRSRSSQNVLEEIEFQNKKYDTSLFVFTDFKLNSNLELWESVIDELPDRVESPKWIGAVHVGSLKPNGLDIDSLRRAKAAGAVRLTTGLESGSQRILDNYAKGADLDTTSEFLHNAASAGISIRATMIHGSPGETPQDVQASTDFLHRHKDLIDRIRISRFNMTVGPLIQRRLDEKPARYPTLVTGKREKYTKKISHEMTNSHSFEYFRATQRLLGAVHKINAKSLPVTAVEFDGVM